MTAMQDWITSVDKRPQDRTARDIEAITTKMRALDVLARLPNHVLQQLAACVYYEDLEKGVTLFRQGDKGCNWYAVLAGTLDVRLKQETTKNTKPSPRPSHNPQPGRVFAW